METATSIRTPKHYQKRHIKQATVQQLTALKLLNEVDPETNKPHTPRKAMIKAGYSKNVANNPKNKLFKADAVQNELDRFHLYLRDHGVTQDKLASKYEEWLNATEQVLTAFGPLKDPDTKLPIMKPNYKVQIEAAKMLKDIFNLSPAKQPQGQPTRRITLEEFVPFPQTTQTPE